MLKTTSPRLPWIDAVRGACVLAVVLLHFCLSAYYPFMWGSRAADAWGAVNDTLTAVRMPTLFAVSGLLLSSRIRKGWKDPRTRYSAVHSLYLYGIWLLIYALIAPWFPTGAQPLDSTQGWIAFASQFVAPHTMLWFILGLAFWTITLATVRFAPAWVVLLALFALTIGSLAIEWESPLDFYIRILRYGFYFAVGVYLRPTLVAAISNHTWKTAGVSMAAYVALRLAMPLERGLNLPFSIVAPLRDLAAVGLAMSVVALIVARLRIVRTPLAWLGKRTLPVYVLHSLAIWTIAKIPGWSMVVTLPVQKYVAPALWTVVVAFTCIAIYAAAMKTPARYLFDMPTRLRATLRRENDQSRTSSEVER